MAGLLEYTKNGQVTEPPLYRFMKGNVQSFLNSIPDPSKMTPEEQLALGANVNPIMGLLGATAYHGSPYLFDKFNINKVGSGEGAQAFGHGIYFAENPKVAEDYARANIGRAVVNEGGIDSLHPSLQVDAYKLLQSKLPDEMKQIKLNDLSKRLTPEQSDFLKNQMNRGNLYKVDIPDQDIPKMLDWDKPISEQSKEVKKALAPYIKQYGLPMNEPGRSAHSMMLDIINQREGLNLASPEAFKALAPKAAQELNKAGIKGIKYLDEGSRELGSGTNNFVIFDPSQVKILERNNKGLLK